MNKKRIARSGITRRKFLPFFSGSFFLSFLGIAKSDKVYADENDDDYQTMLTKDGTVVKVKRSAVQNSKIVDKQLSNKSLLTWLKKKGSDI